MSRGRTHKGENQSDDARQSAADHVRMLRGGRSFSGNERHCFFLNTGAADAANGRFANVSAVSGLDFPDDGRAVALVDWDHDGDQDMWISNRNAPRLRLMRNNAPRDNHFLALRLQGNGTTTSRDAIGARVEVVMPDQGSGKDGPKSIKTLRAGEGFLAQSSKWLHFGLGRQSSIEKVIVAWPGGEIEEFEGLQADSRNLLVQGAGNPRLVSLPDRPATLASSSPRIPPVSATARVPLVDLVAMPKSRYVGADGRERDLRNGEGRMLLINLWAGWCKTCRDELNEFADHHDALQDAGVDVVALTVDGLSGDVSIMADTARLISESNFPFSVGEASARLVGDLQTLHNLHVPLLNGGQLPVPCSFLIDRKGRVAVIYKGRVSAETLLGDVARSEGGRLDRLVRSAPIAGQAIQHPQMEQAVAEYVKWKRFLFGLHFQKAGRADEAARQYTDLLKLCPDSFTIHNNLGSALLKLGRGKQAIAHFQEALRIRPNSAIVFRNLGMAYQAQGDLPEAIARFQQARKSNPADAQIHVELGFALATHGRMTEAIRNYRQALRIDPGDAGAHTKLGVALAEQGEREEAIHHLREALGINPNHDVAHLSLGIALESKGDTRTAIHHFTRALEVNPDYPVAMNKMAWIRATHPDAELRDGAKALALARRCCELTEYRVPAVLATLAAACAELGRFEDAIKWQTKAIELAPVARKTALGTQLENYRKGMPFRAVR